MLFITWFGKKKLIEVFREKQRILLAASFPAISIISTLGSNVETITLLIYYSSVWVISYLFFVSEKNARLFKMICYFIVFLSLTRFLPKTFTGHDYMLGGIVNKYYKYETKTRGYVFLNQNLYRYITEIRSFLESKGLYGKDILAINGYAGLVYLLDSNTPGSVNVVGNYWKTYCDSLPPRVNISVIILDDNTRDGLYDCLADHGIYIKDYKLGKVMGQEFTNKAPTYIYKN